MNSYYSIQERDILRGRGYLLISIAWLMGAFTLWFYANQETAFNRYFAPMIVFMATAKIIGYLGWKDYGRSKGYHWAYGMFSFLPALGPAFIVFLNDRWTDREAPKLKVEKMSW